MGKKYDKNSSDRDIVLGLKNGEGDAFSALIDKYGNNLMKIAFSHNVRDDEYSIVIADVVANMYMCKDSLDPDLKLYQYLKKSVINEISKVQHSESQQHFNEAIGSKEMRNNSNYDYTKDNLIEMVDRAVDKLTPKQTSVYYLRYAEDMSENEIADELNISADAVANTVFKIKKNVKDFVEKALRKKGQKI